MAGTRAANLALRAGSAESDGARAGTSACLALCLRPGHAWPVGAVLAIAGEADADGRGLEALRGRFLTPPPPGADPEQLLRGLLQAVGPEFPAVALVSGGRCSLSPEAERRALLLRRGALLSMAGGAPGNGLSRELEDGDALLLCSPGLPGLLGQEEIVQALTREHDPEHAAARLVRLAGERGLSGAAAAVLSVGVGPALAARLRPEWGAEQPGRTAPLPDPPGISVETGRTEAPGGAPAGPGRIAAAAAAAGTAGAVLGLAAGFFLGRITNPAPGTATEIPGSYGTPGSTRGPGSMEPVTVPPVRTGQRPAAPPVGMTGTPPGLPFGAPSRSRPESSPPARPAAAPAPPPEQREGPPPHALARGMSSRMQVTLALDPERKELLLVTNQGALWTPETGQPVPAGEALRVPARLEALAGAPVGAGAPDLLRGQPFAARGELRLLGTDGAVLHALRDEELRRLLEGERVAIPGVAAGDYRIAWWLPDTPSPGAPVASLRVLGL